jgi:hypothetical protein
MACMSAAGESREVTDIGGRDYNVLWYAEQCLLRLHNHLAAVDSDDRRPQRLG